MSPAAWRLEIAGMCTGGPFVVILCADLARTREVSNGGKDEAKAWMEAVNDARSEAIAALTPIATRELAMVASDHIRKCYDDFDAAHKIWDAAFAEAERALKQQDAIMNERPFA